MGRSTSFSKKNTKKRLQIDDFDKLVIETSVSIRLDEAKTDSRNNCDTDETNCGLVAPSDAQQVDYGVQPKRPMNAFMVWAQAIRRYLHQRFSNVQNASLSKALGRVWRTMDLASREPFMRRADTIKAKHKRDYPDYRYQPRRLQERNLVSASKLFGTNLNHQQQQPMLDYNVNYHQGETATKVDQLYRATNYMGETFDSLNNPQNEHSQQQQHLSVRESAQTGETSNRLALGYANTQHQAADKITHDMIYASSAYDNQPSYTCRPVQEHCQHQQSHNQLYSDDLAYTDTSQQLAYRQATAYNYEAAGYQTSQEQYYDFIGSCHGATNNGELQQADSAARSHKMVHHARPSLTTSGQECIW